MELKYRVVTVRLTESEFELLTKASKTSKMSKSAIITSFINKSLPKFISLMGRHQNEIDKITKKIEDDMNKVAKNATDSISKRN
jgi:hypothetical protein